MNNNIGAEGCKYLSSAKWDHLRHLYLSNIVIHQGKNSIGAEGCKYLSSAKWEELT